MQGYYGKYKGFVRDNNDPERRGRVRAYCPQVMGPQDDKNHWLGWAEGCFPWMGGIDSLDFGPPYTKEQNDGQDVGVWIEFEGGDTDFPIWTGMFIVAPLPTHENAQATIAALQGRQGGSLLANPPSGSDVGPIAPPGPVSGSREVRLLAKKGRDVVLGVGGGGYIVCSAAGVDIVGLLLRHNGKYFSAETGNEVTDG